MKTLQLTCLLALFGFSAAGATTAPVFSPAGTYTFVAPCQPFGAVNAVPNMPGCYSFSATNAGASDPNGYYSWDFGDGSTGVGNPVVHCYPASTVVKHYTATVAYNSTLVCGSTPLQQSSEVIVNATTATGINRNSSGSLQPSLFPNPAADRLVVSSASPMAEIQVFDITGAQVLRRKQAGETQAALTVSDYPDGIYLIKIIYLDATESNTKFIKK